MHLFVKPTKNPPNLFCIYYFQGGLLGSKAYVDVYIVKWQFVSGHLMEKFETNIMNS